MSSASRQAPTGQHHALSTPTRWVTGTAPGQPFDAAVIAGNVLAFVAVGTEADVERGPGRAVRFS